MKTIAYYTPNYNEVIKPLCESSEKFETELEISVWEQRGSWEENCGIKPEFIYEMMNEHQCDLFYVDADSEWIEKPDFSEFKGEHRLIVGCEQIHPPKWEIITSAMFIPYNEMTLTIMKGWVRHCQNNPKEWDQIMLAELLNKLTEEQWGRLDSKYIGIDTDKCILKQHQASREHKDGLNNS